MKHLYLTTLLLLSVALQQSYAQNTCTNAVNIPSLPYNSGAVSTCGMGNDYAVESCAQSNASYEDYIFTFTTTQATDAVFSVTRLPNQSGAYSWTAPQSLVWYAVYERMPQYRHMCAEDQQFPSFRTWNLLYSSIYEYRLLLANNEHCILLLQFFAGC